MQSSRDSQCVQHRNRGAGFRALKVMLSVFWFAQVSATTFTNRLASLSFQMETEQVTENYSDGPNDYVLIDSESDSTR